jgi:hypothetical protein
MITRIPLRHAASAAAQPPVPPPMMAMSQLRSPAASSGAGRHCRNSLLENVIAFPIVTVPFPVADTIASDGADHRGR